MADHPASWLEDILRAAGDISPATASAIRRAAENTYGLGVGGRGEAWAHYDARQTAKNILASVATNSDPDVKAAFRRYEEAADRAILLAAADGGAGLDTPEGLAASAAGSAAKDLHEKAARLHLDAAERNHTAIGQAWLKADLAFLKSHRDELEAADPEGFKNILEEITAPSSPSARPAPPRPTGVASAAEACPRGPVTRRTASGGGQAADSLPHAGEPQNGLLQLVVTDYEGRTGDRGHITRSEKGLIPTAAIAHLKGVKGELPGDHRNRRAQKWEDFRNDIGTHGIKNPIFITVDYGAEPQISEGNERRDAAVELRLPQVPVEIRYFGHAEHEGSVYQRMPKTGGPELANLRAPGPPASRRRKATGSGIASPGGHAHPGRIR